MGGLVRMQYVCTHIQYMYVYTHTHTHTHTHTYTHTHTRVSAAYVLYNAEPCICTLYKASVYSYMYSTKQVRSGTSTCTRICTLYTGFHLYLYDTSTCTCI